MSEAVFAKQFLTTLDSRPTKLSSDHVADPRKLPAQPAHILPHMVKPYPTTDPSLAGAALTSSTSAASPSAGQTATLTLKPLRPGPDTPPNVTLEHLQPRTTSIYDIKVLLAKRTGYTTEKLKLLWQKKPVNDSKTLQDVVGADKVTAAEMAVMYTGKPEKLPEAVMQDGMGAPESEKAAFHTDSASQDVPMTGTAAAALQHGVAGQSEMETDAFWEDLKGFVIQRCRDEALAEKAVAVFKKAWKSGR